VTRWKKFEPILVTAIPTNQLRIEGCGTNVAGHLMRNFSGEKGKNFRKKRIIHARNIALPPKMASPCDDKTCYVAKS